MKSTRVVVSALLALTFACREPTSASTIGGGTDAGFRDDAARADTGSLPGDTGSATGREDSDALCSDGVSNDGDRYVDCDDYDCSDNPRVTVCGDACISCFEAASEPGGACRTQAETCEGNAACAAIRTCVAGCETDECDVDCQDAHPDGWSTYDPLMECIVQACREDC